MENFRAKQYENFKFEGEVFSGGPCGCDYCMGDYYEDDIAQLQNEIEQLKEENRNLKEENKKLREENEKLREELDGYKM